MSSIDSFFFFLASSRVFTATSFHSNHSLFSILFSIPNLSRSCFIPSIHRLFGRSLGLFLVCFHSTAAFRFAESDLIIMCPNITPVSQFVVIYIILGYRRFSVFFFRTTSDFASYCLVKVHTRIYKLGLIYNYYHVDVHFGSSRI